LTASLPVPAVAAWPTSKERFPLPQATLLCRRHLCRARHALPGEATFPSYIRSTPICKCSIPVIKPAATTFHPVDCVARSIIRAAFCKRPRRAMGRSLCWHEHPLAAPSSIRRDDESGTGRVGRTARRSTRA
jgi:hypothetical protein